MNSLIKTILFVFIFCIINEKLKKKNENDVENCEHSKAKFMCQHIMKSTINQRLQFYIMYRYDNFH